MQAAKKLYNFVQIYISHVTFRIHHFFCKKLVDLKVLYIFPNFWPKSFLKVFFFSWNEKFEAIESFKVEIA